MEYDNDVVIRPRRQSRISHLDASRLKLDGIEAEARRYRHVDN